MYKNNYGCEHERMQRTKKTTCEKWLITLILIFVLINGYLLALVLLKEDEFPLETCVNPECVQESSWFLDALNNMFHPCDDFYQFVCGKFISNTARDGLIPPFDDLKRIVQNQVKDVIKARIKRGDANAVLVQKTLYRSCMDVNRQDKSIKEVLLELTEDLGTWPILEGYMRGYNAFDWKAFMYQARRMGLKYDMFYRFVVYENYVTGTNMLKITPPSVTDPRGMPELIHDLVRLLGKEDSEIPKDVLEILIFQGQLNEIIPAEEEEFSTESTSLRKLLTAYQFIPWLDFLSNITYPFYKFETLDDEIIFVKPSYIDSLFQLLQKTPKRTLANYMVWKVIEDLLPLIQNGLQHQNQTNREESCLKTSKLLLPYAVQMGYLQKYTDENVRKEVNEMVHNLKTAFVGILHSINWLDNETKSAAIENIEQVVTYIGAPDVMYDMEKFESILQYDRIEVRTDNFIGNLMSVKRTRHDYAYSHIGKNISDNFECHLCAEVVSVNAFYSHPEKAIILPSALLQGMIFRIEAPKYLNYGALGSIIGHELAHSFIAFINEYYEEAKTTYRDRMQCFADQYDNYFYEDLNFLVNGSHFIDENLADYLGYKLAYLAYKNWTYTSRKTEAILPGLKYTPEQLFWMIGVFRNCHLSKAEFDDRHAVASFRTMSPLRNSLYFNTDFECDEKSFMNLQDKCNDAL